MAGSLEGKVAFITGAGSGIDAATAKIFAREGASLALLDVNVEGGQQIASEIGSGGGEAIFIQGDVSEEEDVRSAIEQTVSRFGRLGLRLQQRRIWPKVGRSNNRNPP